MAVAADHVLPIILLSRGWKDGDLHQVWNSVLPASLNEIGAYSARLVAN